MSMGQDRVEERIGQKSYRVPSPGQAYDSCNSDNAGQTMPDVAMGCSAAYDPSAQINAMLNDLFQYHPPRPDQLPRYQAIRSAARHFAEVMLSNTRSCADQQNALLFIRMATQMANAAVAMDGRY